MPISGWSNDDDIPIEIICDMEKITGNNADDHDISLYVHETAETMDDHIGNIMTSNGMLYILYILDDILPWWWLAILGPP